MRHAKAQPFDYSITSDYLRSLTKSGIEDAKKVGKMFFENNLIPDLILASGAARTSETADLVAKECNYAGKILLRKDIFNAIIIPEILTILKQQPDSANFILFIGHNPLISETATKLIVENHYLSFGTANAVYIALNIDKWSEVELRKGNFKQIFMP